MNKFFKWFFLVSIALLSFSSFAEQRGKYWYVKSGDTLYAIGRAIFPSNPSLQSKLRSQIIRLNQDVFKQGSGSLYIGAELTLPAFAVEDELKVIKPVVVPIVAKVTKNKKQLDKSEWQIKSGDTLYSIARVFYPKSTRRQAKLRNDIVKLNPSVFKGGANRMKVGLILVMPSSLVENNKTSIKIPVVPVKSTAVVVDSVPNTHPARVPDISLNRISDRVEIESTVEPELNNQEKPAPQKHEEKFGPTNYQTNQYTSQYSLATGFSVGGDVAVAATGGRDIAYGSGFNFRLSYDGLWEKKQGYRVSLGYQFDKVTAGSDSGEVDQIYLQSLYLYNTSSSLMGVGISYHDNISLETDISSVKTTTAFEPAIGLILMYEYKRLFGRHTMGVSYTQLESENSQTLAKVDMSRTEIYYKWGF